MPRTLLEPVISAKGSKPSPTPTALATATNWPLFMGGLLSGAAVTAVVLLKMSKL
jgi:hypothetical protein